MTTEVIQMALFSGAQPGGALSLWNAVFPGVQPSQLQTPAPGFTSAGATIEGVEWELQVQVGRVDIFITGPTAAPLIVGRAAPRPPSIPDLDTALADIVSKGKELTGLVKPNRIALVVQGSTPARDAADAIKILAASVPGLPLPQGAVEVDYKINSRISSKSVRGVGINRLCRWANAQRQIMQVLMQPSGPTQSIIDGGWAVLQNIDLNTTVDSTFNPTQASKLFDELATQSKRLVSDGYAAL